MYLLRRLNVFKMTENAVKRDLLLSQGYVEIKEVGDHNDELAGKAKKPSRSRRK